MFDARQILQPRFTYTREISSETGFESVLLSHTNSKEAVRVSQGITEFINDFEVYKAENENLTFQVKKTLYGIMGVLKRDSREYLILIDEATIIGQVLKCNVFRVDEVLIVPLQKDTNEEDLERTGYIEKLVKDKAFYFSYNYNLTHSLQSNVNKLLTPKDDEPEELQKKGGSEEYWSQYESKLVFNRVLCSEYDTNTNEKLWQYIVPLIYGYVFIHSNQFDQNKTDFTLISRKDCSRLGRRFVSRGLDEEGNASNFVETEHIIMNYEEDSYRVASHVQIRGSIPLIWTQTPTLKYAPKLGISTDIRKNKAVAEKHFETTIDKYGEQVLINLIDKKGSQKTIGDAFTKLVKSLKNDKLHYEWFDFHGECKKMKWENLSKLIAKIKDNIDKQDYFMAKLDHAFDHKEKLGPST